MEDALYTTIDFNEQIEKVNKWIEVVSFLTEKAKAIKDLGIVETPLP